MACANSLDSRYEVEQIVGHEFRGKVGDIPCETRSYCTNLWRRNACIESDGRATPVTTTRMSLKSIYYRKETPQLGHSDAISNLGAATLKNYSQNITER